MWFMLYHFTNLLATLPKVSGECLVYHNETILIGLKHIILQGWIQEF